MTKPLVSIITPCYNGEKFVRRFLDSVLEQSYSPIELILVNDGSTDNTEEVVLSYTEKFKSAGIDFIYIHQENKGQAAALNQGLKVFTGQYLTWPDSDDILHKDNILKKVEFLEANKDYGFVMCKTQCVYEDNLDKGVSILERKPTVPDNLFLDLIKERNSTVSCGAYMVCTSAFQAVNPGKHIYVSKTGQNWQMLLPLAYHYKCGYLQEILYYYVMRENSHSRQEKDFSALLNKTYNHEDTLRTVVEQMKIPENDYYQSIIRLKYLKKRLYLAFTFRELDILNDQYAKLQQIKEVDWWCKIYFYCGKNSLLRFGYEMILLPFRVFRKLKRMLLND